MQGIMKRVLASVCAAFLLLTAVPAMAGPVTIDGTITAGEWTGAATYTIGNGGGTAYFKADTNFIYGAFDITGWTSAMGAASHGNLLGFGVWKVNGGYGGTGVEFQQATGQANWGNDGNSGTMNGLVSAWRINGSAPLGSIPGSLQAMDSFATGHRVWEVMMPISTMGVSAGDTIYVVGGINYGGQTHWYPDYFPTTGGNKYAPVTVEAGASVPDGGATLMLLGSALVGLGALRRKFRG
jgi:hypothetical protein